jgi:hypothetical protein
MSQFELPNVNDDDNVLFILYNEVLFMFNGEKWTQIYISDVNLPGTEFRNLKKPAMAEIVLKGNYTKSFLVTGGLEMTTFSFAKTVYSLNIKSAVESENTKDSKGQISYDCLLDFKYGDMKTSRFLHNMLNIDNKFMVVIGGKNEKGWLKDCEALDIATGEWSNIPELNYPRANFDCLLYNNEGKYTIYAYGGFESVGKFPDFLIETCEIDLNSKSQIFSKWKKINLSSSDEIDALNRMPKICNRLVQYDQNILIVGGSDGKHLLQEVFELDPETNEINPLGKLISPRNNFHLLYKEGDVYVVGGSCKEFYHEKDLIQNYSEKFTFNLAGKVETQEIPVLKDIFLFTFENLGIDHREFLNEPGFPYSASVVSKKLK